MGNIKETKMLFDKYLSTNDVRYIDRILINNDVVLKSIKSVLRKYDIDEEKAEAYFGQVYLDVREKLIAKKDYCYDEFNFYSLLIGLVKRSVINQIKKDNELFKNVVLFNDLSTNEISEYSLIKYFNELNENKLTDREKEIMKRVYEELSDKQRKILDMYFGLNGEVQTSSMCIGKSIGMSHGRVGLVLAKVLRIFRKAIFDERERYKYAVKK